MATAAPAGKQPPAPPRPRKVGLSGPTNAGKTTYCAILERALTDPKCTVQTHAPGQETARSYSEQISTAISQGVFPSKTVFKESSEKLYFGMSKGGVTLELYFYDPPGELFEPTANPSLRQEARNQLYQHMRD